MCIRDSTISENFGMRMTFLMSAVLTVAALVILCLFHEEKKENNSYLDKGCV